MTDKTCPVCGEEYAEIAEVGTKERGFKKFYSHQTDYGWTVYIDKLCPVEETEK
jgi:hypothetical protein